MASAIAPYTWHFTMIFTWWVFHKRLRNRQVDDALCFSNSILNVASSDGASKIGEIVNTLKWLATYEDLTMIRFFLDGWYSTIFTGLCLNCSSLLYMVMVLATMALSSACSSRTRTSWVLVLAQSWDTLNKFESISERVRVYAYAFWTTSSGFFETSKLSEMLPPEHVWAIIPECSASIISTNLSGQPHFLCNAHRPCFPTVSNAFVKSVKTL